MRDVTPPPSMSSWFEIQAVISAWDCLQALAYERLFRRDEVAPLTLQALDYYEHSVSLQPYERGLARARVARIDCEELLNECDLLLVPAAPGEAPEGLASAGDPRFNKAWTMLHLPCLTVPMGHGPRACPSACSWSPGGPRIRSCYVPARSPRRT